MTDEAEQIDDVITRLIQAHVASAIRQYSGNLTYAKHVLDNGWLPADESIEVKSHLPTLRQYLISCGKSEDDSVLLRIGLTAPGLQRGIVPPLMVLHENRGGFSARRQREAQGQVERLREALDVGRQFISTLSSDTRQAIVQLEDLCQQQTARGTSQWIRAFCELSVQQAAELTERALSFASAAQKSVREIGIEILQRLANLRNRPLSAACCIQLIAQEVFWPSSLYRDSGDDVARRLVARIEDSPEQLALNQQLLALAWTRSSVTHQAFQRWSNNPPAWTSKLHVPPADYAHNAGWCLNQAGGRRDLISTHCFQLVSAEDSRGEVIPCRTPTGRKCPACDGQLSWLFDFSGLDTECFAGEWADAPRKVLCCLHCAMFEPVYTKYAADGEPTWLGPHEQEANWGPDRFPSSVRRLGDTPFPPFACAEAFGVDDATTLGGMPMWVQDADYPRCLECSELMSFLAQHDNSAFGEEGYYYAFFCAPCRVAAVSYQQT